MPEIARASKELVKKLCDGNWYSTSYLAVVIGKYVRPEVAWRRTLERKVERGQQVWVYNKLWNLLKQGRLERRKLNSREHEWRIIKGLWMNIYLEENDGKRN